MPHQLFLANIPLWCGTSARPMDSTTAVYCKNCDEEFEIEPTIKPLDGREPERSINRCPVCGAIGVVREPKPDQPTR